MKISISQMLINSYELDDEIDLFTFNYNNRNKVII